MLLPIHADPWDIARAYDAAPGATSGEGPSWHAPIVDGRGNYHRPPCPTASVPIHVQRAYWALERYVNLRWADALEDGWRFVRTDDPVENGALLTEAARKRFLFVYDRDHAHPAWSDEANYRFRAVHDVYGHIPQGDAAPFTYAGEVEAAKQQARDIKRRSLDPIERVHGAIQAALTEVIGQAAYFEVHGRFPVQKAAILFDGTVL